MTATVELGHKPTIDPEKLNPPRSDRGAIAGLCEPRHTLCPDKLGNLGNVWAFADQRGGDLFMIRRREFIASLGGAAAWPLAARAQQAARIRRVGVLYPFPENRVFALRMAALWQGLAQFGWIEGRNLRIDAYPGPQEQINDRATELVRSAPDVIVAYGIVATRAVQRRTDIVPIVFVAVGDPVEAGIVKSVARPEGNVTGCTKLFASFGGKWV